MGAGAEVGAIVVGEIEAAPLWPVSDVLVGKTPTVFTSTKVGEILERVVGGLSQVGA